MRRVLFIAFVGLVLISLVDWRIDNEVSQYQQGWGTKNYQQTLFSGSVFVGLNDGAIHFWHWLDCNHDVLLVIFAAALFVVTALLVIYTKKLWSSTSDLVIDAKDTAKKELRAYVNVLGVTRASFDPQTSQRAELVFIEFKNFGQTPAKGGTYWIKMCAEKCPLLHLLEKPENATIARFGSIAPGHSLKVRTNIPLMENGNEIYAGRYALYIYGALSYLDAFEEKRTTSFCYMRSGIGWTSDGEMDECNQGNEAT
jgi:hypothetical protein